MIICHIKYRENMCFNEDSTRNYFIAKIVISQWGEWDMSAGFTVAAVKQRKKRKKIEELEGRVRKLEEEFEKLKKQLKQQD